MGVAYRLLDLSLSSSTTLQNPTKLATDLQEKPQRYNASSTDFRAIAGYVAFRNKTPETGEISKPFFYQQQC